MALGTAASFVGTYTRREHPVKCSKASNAFSSVARAWWGRTQPMVPANLTVSQQRTERRISVRLPLRVRGRDSRGVAFEEDTSSENLCRTGAAFVTRFDVAIGSDLEICIHFSQYSGARRHQPVRLGGPANGNRLAAPRISESDFDTHGRVVHVASSQSGNEKLVGVQFTGPRFQRVFRSESAA